ncbi:shieldin complex subunit 1 [Dromiciops gliroides]|uniref:shieldin complex subunit 1 n=1 Tax=Dromiciops gliroides TaxID=33562 RepID=UPI001CC3D17C|nr:shieldin complex subunit 1 [Dromiciops gliroides]XP_043836389.1 shieldin complex subunit 1 [Dromiciops gliroides]XP_043836390.1 shieldin complex subunit 1 [Dromiciops gliroides]XP_043836391.1 shieldin complex subunit 1 [Dromiciops gliroides]XP_043836392.1 shieldin complex subunit 1 [Dromiciops gliroides]
MEGQKATSGHCSQESSNLLDLSPTYDIAQQLQQKPRHEASSETSSSVDILASFSPDSEASNLNSGQNARGTSEDFWLNHSMENQPETMEDDELRKSLDHFYEVYGQTLPPPGDALSVAASHRLSQKITELTSQESQKYALRSFQMAQVILNRDGYSVIQNHSKDVHFYPLEEGNASLDEEKPTPGLSKDVISFLLKNNKMKQT